MYINRYIIILLLLPLLIILNSCGGGGGSDVAGTEAGKPIVAAGIIKGRLSAESNQSAPSKSIKKGPSVRSVGGIKIRVENSILSAYSDTDGNFEIKNVLPGNHTIIAEYSDDFKNRVSSIQVSNTTGADVGQVTLHKTGKLRGQARLRYTNDNTGIKIYIPGTKFAAYTNRNGWFTMKGIPVTNPTGTSTATGYDIIASKSGYKSYKMTDVTVLPDRMNHIRETFILWPTESTGSITGSVVLEDTSDYSGCTVSIRNTSYSAAANESGIYTISNIPVGTYDIESTKQGYLTMFIKNIPVYADTTTAAPVIFLNKDAREDSDGDGISDDIDADDDNDGFSDDEEVSAGTNPNDPFSYPTGKVTGYINPPGADAEVYASLSGITRGSSVIDKYGYYKIEDLPSGTYTLIIKATGYDESETDNIIVQAGDITSVKDITLTPTVKTGNIQGNILLSNRTDYSGITVSLQGDTIQTTTNSAGEFTLSDINEGEYTVIITKDGYREAVIENIYIFGDETTNLTDIALIQVQGIGATLTGTALLQDSDDHSNILIIIEDASKVGFTDSSGSYSITNIPVGDTVYTVTAIKLNYNETAAQLTFQTGSTTNQDFLLTKIVIADLDGDSIPDHLDADKDGDGVLNSDDAFASDSTEWSDIDGDSIGDNADTDMDNDGYSDSSDAFPKDAAEWLDTDNDGIGDNTDLDDDNDGFTDIEENTYGTNPKDAFYYPNNILTLNTDDTEVNQNYLFDVKVYAKGVTGLKVVYIKITYDAAKLSVLSDTAGRFLASSNGSVTYITEQGSGYIEINSSVVGGSATAVSGSGIISTIKFAALAETEAAAISISTYSLTDVNYNEIPANTVNLTIKIK